MDEMNEASVSEGMEGRARFGRVDMVGVGFDKNRVLLAGQNCGEASLAKDVAVETLQTGTKGTTVGNLSITWLYFDRDRSRELVSSIRSR